MTVKEYEIELQKIYISSTRDLIAFGSVNNIADYQNRISLAIMCHTLFIDNARTLNIRFIRENTEGFDAVLDIYNGFIKEISEQTIDKSLDL